MQSLMGVQVGPVVEVRVRQPGGDVVVVVVLDGGRGVVASVKEMRRVRVLSERASECLKCILSERVCGTSVCKL